MVSNFSGNGFLSSLIKSFEDGLTQGPFKFFVGDMNYEKMSYPAAQYFPENSTYNSDLQYEDTHTVFFLFEKSNVNDNDKRQREFKDNVEKVEQAVDDTLAELDKNDIVKEFKPASFDFLIAEYEGSLLDVIQVDFQVTKIEKFR